MKGRDRKERELKREVWGAMGMIRKKAPDNILLIKPFRPAYTLTPPFSFLRNWKRSGERLGAEAGIKGNKIWD